MAYQTARPLTGITPRAWEHPADKAALKTLTLLPGFDALVKSIFGATVDRFIRMRFLAESVKVSSDQFPKVHKVLGTLVKTLDLKKTPDCFVTYNPQANAGAWGYQDPIIVLHSSILDMLDEEELAFVLAHELAHVASGHALYHTLLNLILEGLFRLSGVGPDVITLYAIILALQEWSRKSELSADRAGLLAVQDPAVAYRTFMKLAGGSRTGEMNLEAFLAQAAEYEASGNVADEVSKTLLLAFKSHPMPVLRLKEAKLWVEGGSYKDILSGNYASTEANSEQSSDTRNAGKDFAQDLGDAVKHYQKEAAEGLDRFMKSFKI